MTTWFLPLLRPRLSALVAASALAGWALQPAPTGRALWPVLGVFLLAAGASALNQVQERELDGRMARTSGRPLPAGRLAPRTALLIAGLFLAAGLVAVAAAGIRPFFFGLLALILYNGVYTPLKTRTAFAVLPGALCGALPPVIGWTAAGGSPADFRCVLLAGLLFLWQVPHFWLFAEKYRDDYRRAGVPVPGDLFNPGQRRRLVCAWTGALITVVLVLPAFGLVTLPAPRFVLFAIILGLAIVALAALRRADRFPAPLLVSLNAGIAGLTAVLLLQRFCS